MKKLCLIIVSVLLTAAGLVPEMSAQAARFNPVRHQSRVIHSNIRQRLRPAFQINSRYSVPVTGVQVSVDGRVMAMLGDDRRVHVWNLATGQKIGSFKAEAEIVGVGFLAHSQPHKLVMADSAGTVAIVNCKGSRAWVGSRIKIDHSLNVSAPHPKLDIVALAGPEKSVGLWRVDAQSGFEKISALPLPETLVRLAFSGDGSRLVGLAARGRIYIWDWRAAKLSFTGNTGLAITSLAVQDDGSMMAAGGRSGRVRFIDVAHSDPLDTIPSVAAKNYLTGLVFVSGSYLLGSCENGDICKWALPSGKLLFSVKTGKNGGLNGIAGIPGDNFFLAAGQDHTLKLAALADGSPVAKLIVLKNGWGVLAKNGCFDGTLKEEPEDHLGALSWFCDKRKFALDGFIARYYQPALLGHLLAGTLPEPLQGAPVIAEEQPGFPLPPLVRIIEPGKTVKTTEREISVTVKAVDQDYGLKSIHLYHNGKIVDDRAVATRPGEEKGTVLKVYRVPLVSGTNRFKAVALNNVLIESEPEVVTVNADWQGALPRLHILTVGISKYDNRHLDLHFARQDAEAIGSVLVDKKNPVYSEIIYHHLYDSDARRSAIKAQLAQLAQLPPQDTVIIYLAGHGETLADEWFFIPYELRHPENGNWLKKGALSSSLLEIYIAGIGARRVFLVIDACKSGAIVDAFADFSSHRSMALLSRLAGIHVFSASTKNQYAGEFGRLGHGLFTYSLLEGLRGPADSSPADGSVTVSEIMSYVETQMPIFIDNFKLPEQSPLANSYGEDFPIIESD